MRAPLTLRLALIGLAASTTALTTTMTATADTHPAPLVHRQVRATHHLQLITATPRTAYHGGWGPRALAKWHTLHAQARQQWAALYAKWAPIAQCESGKRWRLDAYFDGGLQWLPSTWRTVRGRWPQLDLPSFAYQVGRYMQVAAAERWLAVTSWAQWPACSIKVGYR